MIRTMNNRDYTMLESLVKSNQNQTITKVSNFINSLYDNVVETKAYIYAEGDIPIALVAHMDTVFEKQYRAYNKSILYDKEKGIMWYPRGAGFDDKAGIFAIFKILLDGYRPHVIFTTDEEIGGIGAIELIEKEEISPFSDLKYIIELDRQGKNDCVFYDCENIEFTKYVESFGFIESFGSFSDIDIICSEWGIAGVNLSIGYEDEHTQSEVLYVNAMYKTINKVEMMLEDADNAKHYKYILSKRARKMYSNTTSITLPGKNNTSSTCICDNCKKEVSLINSFDIVDQNNTLKNYCNDCLADESIEWCEICYTPYIKDSNNKTEEYINICPLCYEQVMDLI